MGRSDAYGIIGNLQEFIEQLDKNGFDYCPHDLGVSSQGSEGLRIAYIVRGVVAGKYIIISEDSHLSDDIRREKERLRELVRSL